MKYFNQLFSFTICASLALGPVPYVHADEGMIQAGKGQSPTKYSAHAYNRKDFCGGEEGAEKLMMDLQKANEEKFEQIAIYKEEIADLVESDKLISSTRDIRNRYLHSLEKIATEDPELAESYGYTLAAKYDGSVLQAVSDNSKPSKPGVLDSLKTKISQIKNSFSSDLAQDTENKVDQVVAEIPQEITPEQFNKMLKSGSPTLNTLLEKKLNKDDLIACLSENATKDACSKIGISSVDKEIVIDTLKKEMKTFSNQLKATGAFTKIDTNVQGFAALTPAEGNRRIKQERVKLVSDTSISLEEIKGKLVQLNINDSLKNSTANITPQSQMQKTDYEKARDQIARNEKKLVGTDILFYTSYSDREFKALGIDINTPEGAKEAVERQEENLNNAIKDAAIFNKDCKLSNENSDNISSEQLSICQGLVDKIIPKISNLKNSHLDKITELNSKIQKLASDENFANVENLKKYVAEKYLCSCNKKNKNSLSINKEQESLVLKGESCTTPFLTLSKIEGLSSASNAIADALYAHEIKIPMDAESCVMTPEKLKPFSDTCSSNNQYITSNFSDICKQITNEYVVKVQNEELITKQNAKWEKYNEENYVEYNSKSPTGYTAVKKKSTWRVVGEGVLPVLPNALPIWLGNYQMKNNIKTLTDQALLQKQYLHNIDIYNQSPWLYNFNYFGYGDPFTSGSTSLIGGSTGLGGSSGFNFGL